MSTKLEEWINKTRHNDYNKIYKNLHHCHRKFKNLRRT